MLGAVLDSALTAPSQEATGNPFVPAFGTRTSTGRRTSAAACRRDGDAGGLRAGPRIIVPSLIDACVGHLFRLVSQACV